MPLPFKKLILDMDGVLWHGETPLPGFLDLFTALSQYNIPYMLATNNASKTPEQYVKKFARLGVTITANSVVSSATATAAFLKRMYPAESRVFVLGGDGLQQGIANAGHIVVTAPSDPVKAASLEPCAAVVVGFNRQATYNDFAAAALQINNHAADFIGSNPDTSFPSEWGRLPGAGAMLALIEAATNTKPVIIGKPFTPMYEDAIVRLGGDKTSIAMVGDRLNTDIAGAKAVGIGAILVLSGITTATELAASDLKPDFVYPSIVELVKQLNTATLA